MEYPPDHVEGDFSIVHTFKFCASRSKLRPWFGQVEVGHDGFDKTGRAIDKLNAIPKSPTNFFRVNDTVHHGRLAPNISIAQRAGLQGLVRVPSVSALQVQKQPRCLWHTLPRNCAHEERRGVSSDVRATYIPNTASSSGKITANCTPKLT